VVKGANGFGLRLKESDTGFQTIIHLDDGVNDGLEVGDLLLSIDGLGLRGFSHEQIVERLRSFPPESTADLTISRPKSHLLFRRYLGPTKDDIRGQVWTLMEETNLADFPRPCHQRIPNFRGSRNACEKLLGLDCFRKAVTVKVNPDKPQETARFLALQFNKKLLVPTPRLRHGLFNHVLPPFGFGAPDLKLCCNAEGIKHYGIPIPLKSNVQVDLIVVGSVAVSEKGYRIGKGEGFADMEWGMMATMGAVRCDTIVVTIVHDCQVRDIPDELIEPHDITVDIILTPRRIIYCPGRLPRPSSLIWDKITPAKLREIPSLSRLVAIARERGLNVKLPRDNYNNNNNRQRRNRSEEAAARPYRDPHYAYLNRNYAHRSYSANDEDSSQAGRDYYGNNAGRGRVHGQRSYQTPSTNAKEGFDESWSWNYNNGQPRRAGRQNHRGQGRNDGRPYRHDFEVRSSNPIEQPLNANGRPVRFYKREPARRGGRGGNNGFHRGGGGGGGGAGRRGNAQRDAPPRRGGFNGKMDGRKTGRSRLGSIKEEEEKEEVQNEKETDRAAEGDHERIEIESKIGEVVAVVESEAVVAATSPSSSQKVKKDHRKEQKRGGPSNNAAFKSPRFRNAKDRKRNDSDAVDEAAEVVARVLDSVVEGESDSAVDKPEASVNASKYTADLIEKIDSNETPIHRGIEPLMELSFRKDEAEIAAALDALDICKSESRNGERFVDIELRTATADSATFSADPTTPAAETTTPAAKPTTPDAEPTTPYADPTTTAAMGAPSSCLSSTFDDAPKYSSSKVEAFDVDAVGGNGNVALKDLDLASCDGRQGEDPVSNGATPKHIPATPTEANDNSDDSDSDCSTSSADSHCFKVMTPSLKSASSVVEIVRHPEPVVDSETESEDEYEDPTAKESCLSNGIDVEDVAVEIASSGKSPEGDVARLPEGSNPGVNTFVASASKVGADGVKTAPTRNRIFGKVCNLLKSSK